MESQASRFKEAIIEVLLKRIIPLEKQLEAQTEIIDQLTSSLESLAKTLTLTQDLEKPSISSNLQRRSSLGNPGKYVTQKSMEKKKEADIQEIKKAFVLGISKLKIQEDNEEKKESKDAGEPDSEVEDEVEKEEEQQIFDIELGQLGDVINAPIPEFFYSDIALGAIAALAELDQSQLYLTEKPYPKIRWIMMLFWQLQGKEYGQNESWDRWKEFIQQNTGKLEEVFFQMRNEFDFSMGNLDKLEPLLKRRKNLLNPALFNYSPVGSHLMAIVKNVIEFSGVISAASAMRCKRLLYKKNQVS